MEKPFLPYGRQLIDDDDVAAVAAVLRSDWLTTGPVVEAFEEGVADFVGARHGVAVNSGTAALHAVMHAIGIGPGDEVIVPAMTFVATSNSVLYQGGTPVFVDIDPETLLIDPEQVAAKLTSRTKAIVGVDYAGQPCDYDALRRLADRHNLYLLADGCHALGAAFNGRKVGTLADCTVFSFHPVKHITTGEGGMAVTGDPTLAERMRCFRNHGIATDHRKRESQGTWYYEMVGLGFNYRISDIQCALGLSQLAKLPGWLVRRREIADHYNTVLEASIPQVAQLRCGNDLSHAYHLYVVRLAEKIDRGSVYRAMRQKGIGVNVHYLPVHLHPYYRQHLGTGPGLCPVAEAAYGRILSLPMHQGMSDADVVRVTATLGAILGEG